MGRSKSKSRSRSRSRARSRSRPRKVRRIKFKTPNIVLQEILEEIKENAMIVEDEVSRLLQFIKTFGERGGPSDVYSLADQIIARTMRKSDLSRPLVKHLKTYRNKKEMEAELLRINTLQNKGTKNKIRFHKRLTRPHSDIYLNARYEDVVTQEPTIRVNQHVDKIPLQTIVKDEEKEFHSDLVALYMRLQSERLLFKEKFKKPETLVEAVQVKENIRNLLEMESCETTESEEDEEDEEMEDITIRYPDMPADMPADMERDRMEEKEEGAGEEVEEEEKKEKKEDLKQDREDKTPMPDDREPTAEPSEATPQGTEEAETEDWMMDSMGTYNEEEQSYESVDEEEAEEEEESQSSDEDEEREDARANKEARRLLHVKLKAVIDDPNEKIVNIAKNELYTPEVILQELYASKSALRMIDLENDCLELFLIKNDPRLLLNSDIISKRHHRITRDGRIVIKLLSKNKLLKPMLKVKRRRKMVKCYRLNDDRSISTESTDVSSSDEFFPFLDKKKVMVIQATEDLRRLCNIVTQKLHYKFVKATDIRHELFSHYLDIMNQEKLFKKATTKVTHHVPQVFYLFWKRWLLSNLHDLIFMETRGRLIAKSLVPMVRMDSYFRYLESITQYGDKLEQQVLYDTVAEEYNLLSDGVYDLRKAIADLLNDIFFRYHKIDNKLEEYNQIKDEVDNIQAQTKTCNRIRRREKEKYNKIKSILDAVATEPKKVSVFRTNDQESPNLKVYIRCKMRNNFTRHALNKMWGLVRSQEHKVKSLTESSNLKVQIIKNRRVRGFDSFLRIIKRKLETWGGDALSKKRTKSRSLKSKYKIRKAPEKKKKQPLPNIP